MADYKLAEARLSHIDEVYRLCIKSLRAGPEGSLPFSKSKIMNVLHSLISDPHQLAVVALTGGKVRGLVLGSVSPHAYADGLIADEIALYVAPVLRGTDCYKALAGAYDAWCSRVPNLLGSALSLSQLNATTPVMDSLYKSLGYKRAAVSYIKLSEVKP